MNRVVVTGMGIVSSLGANKLEVLESLKSAKSGIAFSEKYKEMGLNTIQANNRGERKDAGHIVAQNCGGQNKASNYMWEDRHDNRAHGDAKIKMSEMKRAGRR